MSAPPAPTSNQAFRDRARDRMRPRTITATVGGPGASANEEYKHQARLRLERHEKNLSDEEFAARFVNQRDIKGPPGDISIRTLMSFLGDTFEEREEVFRSARPEGDILQVPSTDLVLYRNTPDEQYRQLDPGFLDAMAETGRGKELLADISEMAGQDLLNIGGEALFMFLLRKRPGVASTMIRVARSGIRNRLISAARRGQQFLTRPGSGDVLLRLPAGGAAGEVAQQAAQTVAGTQRETLGEQAKRVGFEAGVSVLGGTLGAAVGAGINVARGRGIFQMTPEGARAVRAAERLQKKGVDVEAPLPIQVVDAPAVRLIGRQAASLLPRIPRAIRRVQEKINRSFQNLSNRKERNGLIRTFTREMESFSNDTLNLVRMGMRSNGKTPRDALILLRETVTDWWTSSGKMVDSLYTAARAIETPQLTIDQPLQEGGESLLGAVARIKRGVVGVGRSVQRESDIGLVDASGRAIQKTVEEETSVQARNLNRKLLKELDRLEALDPSLPTREGFDDPVEVLREIRKNLNDLSLPGPEGPRQPNLLAAEVRGKITEVLENPINDSPEFVRAWSAANRAAKKRFDTREQVRVVEIVNSARPDTRNVDIAGLMDGLVRPGSFDSLNQVVRAGGKPALDIARDAFGFKMMAELRAGRSLNAFLNTFDEPTLRLLMPPTAEGRRMVRLAADAADVLINSNIPRAVARQSKVRAFVQDLIETPKTRELDDLLTFVNARGGRNGPTGRALRASLIDEIWRRGHKNVGTRRKLDATNLNRVLDEFSEKGLLRFFMPSELKLIRNFEILQRAADVAAVDAGTALQAAQAVAGVRGILVGNLEMGALHTFIENYGVGRLMVTDAGRKFLTGAAGKKPPTPTTVFKLVGAMSATLAADTQSFADEDVERLTRALGVSKETTP